MKRAHNSDYDYEDDDDAGSRVIMNWERETKLQRDEDAKMMTMKAKVRTSNRVDSSERLRSGNEK